MHNELTGQKFGRLTVLEKAGINKNRVILWKCVCACGKIKIVRSVSLRNGHTKSCGCLQKDIIRKIRTTHGMQKTLIYKIWAAMLQRCNNPKDKAYKDYGGRGIKVCERWLKFENFFADMGERPENLTIERIDNDKGYYKKNCGWRSRTEQARNQRMCKPNKTGFTGVSWHKQGRKYQVYITANYKRHYLGLFAKLQEAIKARNQAEQKFWAKNK